MEARPSKPAAMADVAALAGVSSQTVSRVANGATNVKEATRLRVIQAMREIGYRPNGAARALKRGSYGSVGVITFTLASYGNIRTVEAISARLADRGYSLTLINVPDRTMGSISGAYNRLADEAVDAVIVLFEARLIDQEHAEFPPGLPVVVVDSQEARRFPTLDTDQAEGAALATEHLITLGHRDILHLAGPEGSFSAERRTAAWADTMARHGLPVRPSLRGDWSAESGYAAGAEIARQLGEVTAVFAANDAMALGVMRAMHELGVGVPHDLSVVGFDNTPESSCFWPPLTTVSQDFDTLGRICVELVAEGIEDGSTPNTHHLVPTELVVRQSTAPPIRA
ncbi:substrate-binding domain-containing protein [Galbitalea sp. SE-J8]|uniref:LacI family DNA-binding transcriptional regulator n=1 Tax=Galbitalea sp. SE-J8 TaxID=3054952 RepID=UPI00259D0A42|nr:substrate-binding domain-containing protein [Galbitalea sp. SE-J8]MDM4764246.1 substrate-binding domain-containing protein [Galbitalea sp. SE-J8]